MGADRDYDESAFQRVGPRLVERNLRRTLLDRLCHRIEIARIAGESFCLEEPILGSAGAGQLGCVAGEYAVYLVLNSRAWRARRAADLAAQLSDDSGVGSEAQHQAGRTCADPWIGCSPRFDGANDAQHETRYLESAGEAQADSGLD